MGAPTITVMALTVGEREVRPLTADEVVRMVEVGILSEDDPVELLHGVLTVVSAKSPEHASRSLRVCCVKWRATTTSTSRAVLSSRIARLCLNRT